MDIEPAQPVLHSLRVALLGDPQVGKKTFIQKLAKRQNQYIISPQSLHLCQNQLSIHLNSNNGPCQVTFVFFNINLTQFETNKVYSEQVITKLKTCSNALLMFSLLSRQTYKNIPNYHRIWMTANENGNSILISTKLDDEKNYKIKQKMICYHRKKNLNFYNTSSKAAYNLVEPFAYMFKKNLKNLHFAFIDPKNYVDMHPEVPLTNKQEIQKLVHQISSMVLPYDNDDL